MRCNLAPGAGHGLRGAEGRRGPAGASAPAPALASRALRGRTTGCRPTNFSQNTRGKTKYGLVVMDVEAAVEPLQNKNAETVGRATKRAARELTGDDGNFVVTTDLGNEFATLGRELPEAVRRTKRPEVSQVHGVSLQTIFRPLPSPRLGEHKRILPH